MTNYQASNDEYRQRVTTIARNFVEPGNPDLVYCFDQEAAAVIMARIAVFKSGIDDGPDVRQWLDRMLIRLVNILIHSFICINIDLHLVSKIC